MSLDNLPKFGEVAPPKPKLAQPAVPSLDELPKFGERPKKQQGLIKAWSFSKLKKFQTCQHQVYLEGVAKIKPESGEAANRGTRIHDEAEKFVRGEFEELPASLKRFESDFMKLREAFERGEVTLEEDWGFTTEWESTGFFDKNVWCRMKLDAFHRESPTSAVVIDYKSGKKFGNELTHQRQTLNYAIGTFHKHPELSYISTQLWYIDTGEKLIQNYNRAEALLLQPGVEREAHKLTDCVEFFPNPSKFACKWCYYKESGDCEYAE